MFCFGFGFGKRRTQSEVVPPFSPADLAPLRAWDVGEGGASSATIPAAFGATGAVTLTNNPALRAAYAPDDSDLIEFTAASTQWGTFASTAVGAGAACTVLLVIGNKGPSGTTQRVIGQAVSANQYIGLDSTLTNMIVRTNGGVATNLPFPGGVLAASCDVMLLEVTAAGMATLTLNGVAGTPVSIGATGFTLDQLGRTGSFINGFLSAALIFDRALTAPEKASLLAYYAPRVSSTYYVAAAGSAANPGWSAAAPWAALSQLSAFAFRAGDVLVLKGGDTWRLTAQQSFGTNANVTLDGGMWSTGTGWANVYGSIRPTDWASLGAGIWSRAEAQHPYNGGGAGATGYIFDTAAVEAPAMQGLDLTQPFDSAGALYAAAGGNPMGERLDENIATPTLPAAGQFGWLAGTLYVHLADEGDPNNRVEVAYRTTGSGTQMSSSLNANTTGARLKRLNVRYVDGAGVSASGAGAGMEQLDVRYCLSDGINGAGSGTAKDWTDCLAAYCGNKATAGSDGDGYSNHGGTGTYLRCYGLWNDKCAGIDDVEDAVTVANQCWAYGTRPFMTAGNSAVQAAKTFTNCLGIVPDGVAYPHGFMNRGGTVTLRFCTFVGVGARAGKSGVFSETPGGLTPPVTTLRNCIVDEFDTGFNNTGGTFDEDYSRVDVTTRNVGSVPVGGNSTTGDPLFVGGGNFSLQGGSPCIAAGLVIGGVTSDFASAIRNNPPSVGAMG